MTTTTDPFLGRSRTSGSCGRLSSGTPAPKTMSRASASRCARPSRITSECSSSGVRPRRRCKQPAASRMPCGGRECGLDPQERHRGPRGHCGRPARARAAVPPRRRRRRDTNGAREHHRGPLGTVGERIVTANTGRRCVMADWWDGIIPQGKRLAGGVCRSRRLLAGSARDSSPILNRASPVSRHCGVSHY